MSGLLLFHAKSNIVFILMDIQNTRYTVRPWDILEKKSWHHFKTPILGNVDGFWLLWVYLKQTDVDLLTCVLMSVTQTFKAEEWHTYTKYLMEYMFEMMIHKHTKTVSFMIFYLYPSIWLPIHYTLFQINNSIEDLFIE